MKKIAFLFSRIFILHFLDNQIIDKCSNEAKEATFSTINIIGKIVSNGTICCLVGSFRKLILNTVTVKLENINNYDVSNASVLIITGIVESTFDLYMDLVEEQ
jgi:hypothetical protein